MSSNQAPNNVIQFPSGRKKETEETTTPSTPAAPSAEPKAQTVKKPSKKTSKKNIGAGVLAIMLFTGAANKYVFGHSSSSTDLASNGEGRGIASVSALSELERFTWNRDAQWEKQVAERLASVTPRELASTNIGRSATKEEKLRWGTLEEKYTITYKADDHKINSILLQDPSQTNPAYILDRSKFLSEYGMLFDGEYGSAKLKSVETQNDKTVESYTIFDKDQKAKGEARFELDRHKRLLSLKVEPVQI
jgi:hypothetical protein